MDGADVISNDDRVSLQEAFSKFRSRKIQELKLARFNQQESLNRSSEYKESLRAAFIQSAMSYLGVPYSKRYKEEGAEEAPLYLDCCGLVRRVVQDNQDKFGFLIGRWNQCYQMDTLPVELEEKDLKPGDLIFYEGKYFSSKHKPQKHNNVHVEIFIGGDTGEATIGARLKRGVVSIFPSYKFESSSWELIRYHFRSIDTWLDGKCVSHCSEHPWIEEDVRVGAGALRNSIFYAESDEESAGDSSESDVEVDDKNDSESTSPYPTSPAVLPTSSPTGKLATKSHSEIIGRHNPLVCKKYGKSTSLINRAPVYTYYVNKSNGWKLVKGNRILVTDSHYDCYIIVDALDRRGWQQLPFEHKFSTKFNMKWYLLSS